MSILLSAFSAYLRVSAVEAVTNVFTAETQRDAEKALRNRNGNYLTRWKIRFVAANFLGLDLIFTTSFTVCAKVGLAVLNQFLSHFFTS